MCLCFCRNVIASGARMRQTYLLFFLCVGEKTGTTAEEWEMSKKVQKSTKVEKGCLPHFFL